MNTISTDELTIKLQKFFHSHTEKSYRLPDILAALGLSEEDSSVVKRSIRKLVSKKYVQKLKGKKYSAITRSHLRSGTFEQGRFGSGRVRTDNGELHIPQGCSGTALPGDLVKIEVIARRSGPNPEGRVIEILKRVKHEFVGEFLLGSNGGFVQLDSDFLKRQIYIPQEFVKKARNGQRVAVKIVKWDNEYTNPAGEIIEVIGFPGEIGVDVLSIAIAAGIPKNFPKKVIMEADSLKPGYSDLPGDNRKDFREDIIFTIDPEEAKDFDDAVSLKKLADGNWLLGVYIADVTAYVHEGSAIDKEAAMRGTSVYLINKVIPMLPERLSNDLCSLRPDEDRPAYCILMTCKPDGEVVDYEITQGIIRSKYRFSYKKAQDVIDGKKNSPYAKILRTMNDFAKVLRKKRFRKGGMDFYVPEVSFKIDDSGVPSALTIKPVLETNILIEEFMLLANIVAARHKRTLERKYKMSLPFIYRVHDEPNTEKIKEFAELARSLGCKVNKGTPGTSPWFQNILRYFSDKPEKTLIEEIALRSMMKAVYQPRNIGHFGLGFKEYTHFTSPIRRYPDLVVHRTLKKYAKCVNSGEAASLKRKLNSIGKHSTEMEIRAMKAEREVVKLKKLEYMRDKIGDVFKGVITGVTSFGVFIALEDILVEGLIHVRDMDDDFYVYEEKKYRLKGQRSGKSLKLGNRVTVRVIKVNVERRHLDFMLV